MSLDYVKAGEPVKATTINSIIETIGGNQSMSPDLNVTTTARGPQVYMPSKYGGPNNPLRHYLDTGKYVLSSGQFVKIVLGPTLDDCLGTFKYHVSQNEVCNPISAAIVFKNSSGSPVGDDLSGYLLDEPDFGKDAGAHSAGWVETLIEDTNGKVPTMAELWSWKLPDKMAAVFTNVQDELSVKGELSTLLEAGGISGSELSGLERVGSWKLTSSTALSVEQDGNTVWVDTHELVNTHDTIDVWASESIQETHINMAELVCYYIDAHDDPGTGAKILDNAKFAWRYWLGPDSDYEEGETIKFVYSHSWTINGQPAVFQVEDEIDSIDQYDGQTVAIADERGGYSIMYGDFETNSEGEETSTHKVDAGSLFVNFNYYDAYACMLGEFGRSNNSTTSELSKSTFICKQKEEYVIDEISLGDVVPRRFFAYGTFSTVDKDWPLTDSTCPENEEDGAKNKQSLEWKDNKPEEEKTEPVDATGVKSLQLFKFSEVVKEDCDMLSDLQLSDKVVFVARREDEDGNAWVDYINLDGISSQVDSNLEDLYLSSIQEKMYETEDGSVPYHQLFGFEGGNIELDFNNLDKFDLVVRDKLTPGNGAQVSYIPISAVLSGADTFTDTQISQMSSIQYDDDGNGPYLELFQFNQGNNLNLGFEDFGRYDLVVRDNTGNHVDYATLSGIADSISTLIVDALSTDVDSELPPIELSSIQTSSWTDPETDEEHKYHQLFNFQVSAKTINYSSIGCYNIVLRDYEEHPGGAIVSYTPLSDLAFRPDSDGDSGQKSTSFLSGTRDLQLWRFDEAGESDTSALVPTYFDDPAYVLSDELEFVLRRGGAGGEIEYRKLLLKQDMLSVDKQGNPNQKSLQYCDLGNGAFLELDHFHSNGTTSPKVVLTSADTSLLPDNQEFVIRKKVGGFWQIDYTPLSACLSGVLSGATQVDSEIPNLHLSSIQTKDDGTQSYHQLFNFDNPGKTIQLSDLGNYEMVVRDFAEVPGGEVINFVKLSNLLHAQIEVDTDVVGTQRSIEWAEDDGREYLQLYGMDGPDADTEKVTIQRTGVGYHLLPDDYTFVVRTAQGGHIEYKDITLCCMLSGGGEPTISCDNEVVGTRKSLDLIRPNNAEPYYQMHNFQNAASHGCDTWVMFYDQPYPTGYDIAGGLQFVVRVPDGNGGYHIEYQTLSAFQEHERVDSWATDTRGYSINYDTYDNGNGCYQVLELYGFSWGCTNFVTSADISANGGNGILYRKWDDYGCCWQLDYMDFNSLDELAIKYIGDKQLSQPPHNPYRYSTEVQYDYYDQKKYIELYNFGCGGTYDTMTIRNDGCTYYWPQDVRTDHQMSEWDYVLVKHVDSNGNAELQYRMWEVTMPDIDVSGIESDITNIYEDVYYIWDDIWYLSGVIDEISSMLSDGVWRSGGDSSTNYGSTIGNSSKTSRIDIDNCELLGCIWTAPNFKTDYVLQTDGGMFVGCGAGISFMGSGCTYISDSYAYFAGCVQVGCYFSVGCSYLYGNGGGNLDGCISITGSLYVSGDAHVDGNIYGGCTLTLGCTSINESQLSALLQLL